MHFDRHLVGWGVIFVLLGAIPLAVQGGYLDADLVGRWPELWPLLIAAIGVSLLLTRTPANWLGSVAVAVVVGVMGGSLLATGWGGVPSIGCGGGTAAAFAGQGGSLGQAATVNVEFNCGQLSVDTTSGSTWELHGNDGDGHGPIVDASADRVAIRPATDIGTFFQRGQVSWILTLPQASVLDLGLTLNAGDGELQLSGAKLSSLNLTVNAGSLSATLGPTPIANAVNVTVNAGSATLAASAPGTYNLSLNAGSLDLCSASGTAARIRWSGVLASNDLDGLGLVKVDDRTWTTTGFDPSAAHLDLDVTANAGSFTLNFGGSCSGS